MHVVKVTRTIAAPIDEVWAVTSSFGAIRAWMPDVQKCGVEGAGIGAVRTVTTAMGVAKETLTEIDATAHRVRYDVELPGLPAKGLIGGTDLTAVGAGKTRIDWVSEAESVDVPVEQLAAPLGGFMENCLNGLARFLKTSIE